jgi:UDP-glucose 4-epimerase
MEKLNVTLPSDYRTAFVTGAAGFIGSSLVDRLLAARVRVVGYDNLSTGMLQFIVDAQRHCSFTFIVGDMLDLPKLADAIAGADIVFHFAANADVRFGLEDPRRDLEQNTIATFNVLEAMRANGIKNIVFASTGSVYGEAGVIPTPEEAPFPIQTSLYAASKLAGEGLIAAYCEGFGMRSWIFRLVSIVGERYTHGHVFDFYKKLLADPTRLHVLGNGRQRKSYLYIQDCVDAIFHAISYARDKVNVLNLGSDEYCDLDDSINWIAEYLGVNPERNYNGGDRGWIGDIPFIFLDTTRIRALGWKPKLNIRQGIERTVAWLGGNHWVLERRP